MYKCEVNKIIGLDLEMISVTKSYAKSQIKRSILFLSYFSPPDTVTLGMGSCACDVPCTRIIYDATISSSLLDTRKLQTKIQNDRNAVQLLPLYQDALEVSYQVSSTLVDFI